MDKIYTIGYSAFTIDQFFSVLNKYNINIVIDIRSFPKSSFFNEYNKESLFSLLKKGNIHYYHYKNEFGAYQEDPSLYTDSILDFKKVIFSRNFQKGIIELKKLYNSKNTVVLMCAEKDPIDCHRSIMVGNGLRKEFDVKHICSNGTTICQEDIDQQLIKMYYPTVRQLSIFDEAMTELDIIESCYRKQNQKIGHSLKEGGYE